MSCARINFMGDIMLGDSYHMLGIGVGTTIVNKGTAHVFERVKSFLSEADLNIGNLECSFSDKTLPMRSLSPYIGYSPHFVDCLKVGNLHIVSMANNHTMQYGADIFQVTQDLLLVNDIRTIGTVRFPWLETTVNGIRFAFVAYSLRPDDYNHAELAYVAGEKTKILDDVQYLAARNDHVIVSLHWGDEYVHYPHADQIALAHEIIDIGASGVIGHHPHVLQGIEIYKTGVIAYSLGNFVFDKPQMMQRLGVILQLSFRQGEKMDFNVFPIWINNRFQPEMTEDEDKKRLIRLLSNFSRDRVGGDESSRYHEDVLRGLRNMRLQFLAFLMRNFYRYRPSILTALICSALRRRLRWRLWTIKRIRSILMKSICFGSPDEN